MRLWVGRDFLNAASIVSEFVNDMATGDLDGNLNRLLQELRLVRFPVDVDEVGLRLGDPVVALQILHYVLCDYSGEIAQLLLQHGFELRGKTDQRFVEAACRVFRDVLEIRPVLTSTQILQQVLDRRLVRGFEEMVFRGLLNGN